VLYSGVVAANMLAGMPMEVEVGSAELAPAAGAEPETGWFADGATLAPKVPGKGTLTVAALGPRPAPGRISDTDPRIVSARAYELRRGSARYLGSVVEVGGKAICTSVLPAGTPPDGPHAWALRCPVPGGTTGLVHVVGAPGTTSVAVSLDPTRSPPGQRAFSGTMSRPEGTDPNESFAVLQVVASGFPCGPGTVQAEGNGATKALRLPAYTP